MYVKINEVINHLENITTISDGLEKSFSKKRDKIFHKGQHEAYSQILAFIKRISFSNLKVLDQKNTCKNEWIPFEKKNYNLYETLIIEKNCQIKFGNGDVRNYEDPELPFDIITHFRAKKNKKIKKMNFFCSDESKKAEKCKNQCTGCFMLFQQQIIEKLKDFESLDVHGNSYIKQKHYLKLSQELIEVLYSNAT